MEVVFSIMMKYNTSHGLYVNYPRYHPNILIFNLFSLISIFIGGSFIDNGLVVCAPQDLTGGQRTQWYVKSIKDTSTHQALE